jgi:hypothetical protein
MGAATGPACGAAKVEKSKAAGWAALGWVGGAMAAKSNGDGAGATGAGTYGAAGGAVGADDGGASELKSKAIAGVAGFDGYGGDAAGIVGTTGRAPRSGLLVASTPSAKTPGRVTSAFIGGSAVAPKRANGSALGPGGGAPSAGTVAVAGCAMSRVTRNVCAHLVQRTFTPLSVTLSSGILNRVWHCSHLTIIGGPRALYPGSETKSRGWHRRKQVVQASSHCVRGHLP